MKSNYQGDKIIGRLLFAKLQAFVLLAIFLYSSTIFAMNINSSLVKGVAQTYGYVLGQEYTLSRIANDLPEMTIDVELARGQFNSAFPDIKNKLETQLKQALGEKLFQETKANLQIKLTDTLGSQQITREIAESYFKQVKDRSKGEIESPVLEYLLAVKYSTNPVDEYRDGFRQRYETDGMGKSQGIKVNIQLPRSWLGKDGERPHIVQKWTSENGTGIEMILLDIRDGEGYNPTKKYLEDFVRSGDVKNTVPDGSSYIASGNFTLEKQNGYWVQMSTSHERIGVKMYQKALMYQFFFRGKSIGIMCQSTGFENEKSKINDSFKLIQPLCQQVLNSIVLPQIY